MGGKGYGRDFVWADFYFTVDRSKMLEGWRKLAMAKRRPGGFDWAAQACDPENGTYDSKQRPVYRPNATVEKKHFSGFLKTAPSQRVVESKGKKGKTKIRSRHDIQVFIFQAIERDC